jgi:hypothetical protein
MYFSFPASLDRLLKERWAYLITEMEIPVDWLLLRMRRLNTLLAHEPRS